MIKAIIGWFLIVLGIVVIIWSISSTYYNFTGQSEFPQMFEDSQNVNQEKASGSIEDQIGSIVGEQIKNMLPSGTLPKMLNMVSWTMFVTFLVFAGSKMAGLGINLLRNPKKEES